MILRDDKPGLPWANLWDFPGGGREEGESPEACMIRETREEVGLDLTGEPIPWQRPFPSRSHPGEVAWFFVVRLPETAFANARLGDEGQAIDLMAPETYLSHPRAIDFLQDRLRLWLDEGGRG